jgi:hypothetical protein
MLQRLHRPDRVHGATARQRRSRVRRRRGRLVLRVEVPEYPLIEALQLAGRVDGLSESAMHR